MEGDITHVRAYYYYYYYLWLSNKSQVAHRENWGRNWPWPTKDPTAPLS